MERSIAGQVEFWARLGRAVELVIGGRQLLQLSRSGAARPLSECLSTVDSPEGRERVAAYLATQPFPHYRPHPDKPGFLERIQQDGKIDVGRFVNRTFVTA